MNEIYENKSRCISWGIEKIQNDEIVIPLIQRKFVWSDKQVISLLDSVLQDFPISAILLNLIEPNDKNLYYKFLTEVKQDSFSSSRISKIENQTYSILDGQQRLTALRLCFDKDCFFVHKPKYKRDERNAYLYVCLSHPVSDDDSDNHFAIRFFDFEDNDGPKEFIIEHASKVVINKSTGLEENKKENKLWVRPYKILEIFKEDIRFDLSDFSGNNDKNQAESGQNSNLNEERNPNSPSLEDYLTELADKFTNIFPDYIKNYFANSPVDEIIIRELLAEYLNEMSDFATRIFQRYYVDTNILNCVILKASDPDNVTDIFVRLNTGGVYLSYSDLLVTKLSSFFETKEMKTEYKDAKKRIAKTILEKIPERVRPDEKSILKTLLVLCASNSESGSPAPIKDVSYSSNIGFNSIAKLNGEKLEKIHSHWNEYAKCIICTYKFLDEILKLDKKTLKSYNAVIPIILYFWLKGVKEERDVYNYVSNKKNPIVAKEIKWYLYIILFKNTFGSGSGDTILSSVCSEVHKSFELNSEGKDQFSIFIQKITDLNYQYFDRFHISEFDIEQWMNKDKGDKLMYPLLSLLYPKDFYNLKDINIDHMHPKAGTSGIEIGPNLDKIVNLKFLSGFGTGSSGAKGNKSESNTPLIDKAKDWLSDKDYDNDKNPIFSEEILLMPPETILSINKAYASDNPGENPLSCDYTNLQTFFNARHQYISGKFISMFIDCDFSAIPVLYDFQ